MKNSSSGSVFMLTTETCTKTPLPTYLYTCSQISTGSEFKKMSKFRTWNINTITGFVKSNPGVPAGT